MSRYHHDPELELKFRNAISNTGSMREASLMLGISYQTFRSHARRLGLFEPNQGARGSQKWKPSTPIEEILAGIHPNFDTGKLKGKLLKTGMKQNKCEVCGVDSWQGKPLVCQLDHIDGNRRNHRFENLRMLCPNCHSQTPTYCGRNVK